MVLEIHEDAGMEFRRRQVSFQKENTAKTPLTPYNRQRKTTGSKPLPAVKTPKPTAITMAMEGKENLTNVSLLRRSIRSTMSQSSTANSAQLSKLKTPSVAERNRSSPSDESSPFSPLSSILRRSMLQSGRLGPPQRVQTPTSSRLLENELDRTDVDMSLLISPSAMGNPNDVVKTPAHEAFHSNQSGEQLVYSMSPTGDPKFTARGNGVQMDLTDMFSEFNSPDKDVTTSKDTELPTVFTRDLRLGVVLDFGDGNVVGHARSLPFVVASSPGTAEDFFLEIERIPFTKGINLVVSDPSSALLKGLTPSCTQSKRLGGPVVPNVLTIKSGESAMLWVTWTPVEPGGIREVILLKLPRGPGRLRVTVLGQASIPKPVSDAHHSLCAFTVGN